MAVDGAHELCVVEKRNYRYIFFCGRDRKMARFEPVTVTVLSFTHALCRPALYCLRYLLLLPRAKTFGIYGKFITNYTTVVRQPPGVVMTFVEIF